MTFKEKWLLRRKKERSSKEKDRVILLKTYANCIDYKKLDELTKLYIDCHDLMTKVGKEISEIADNNSKGC